MKNTNNSGYQKNTDNPQEQLLSHFGSHINKYPDGPKDFDIEIKNAQTIPQIDLDEEEEEHTIEDENEEDSNHFDDDYEERYILLESNRDDFSETGY